MLLILLSCATAPQGLRLTPAGDGAVVRIDWDAEPLPDIPFPNDLATRPDPTSRTGLRVNVPTAATIEAETEAREKLNQMSGFGVYAPITVAFEGRLDLDILWDRHGGDERLDLSRLDDDAVYIIDVTPDSPTYGQPVELDLGEGRYPYDACDSARYFPNDPRADQPSVVFETFDEDLNGDGVLDWGEDTDNDGVLDKPNVHPEGGDARDDLLVWYELQSDTLILRPVVPLRERTTYAVVLTSRLVDENHQPIRSPWPWVNHTAQTPALEPLNESLPALGLGVDDVAFAWTFTTGDVTGDLVDMHEASLGEGPYGWLTDEIPPAIHTAQPTWDAPGAEGFNLPVQEVMTALVDLGQFDPVDAAVVLANYEAFGDRIVGGVFTTPYLLADKDDGGFDDSDEWFVMDPSTGKLDYTAQDVAFTCVLPKEGQQPFPVAIYGHGYGSSRFEFLGFAHAFNRLGYAACAMDFPGHGPTVGQDEQIVIETLLEERGLLAFWTHLRDARYRDLNNDGKPDSGGDQWSADAFHTRDIVRQAVVDWMWMVQGFERCGLDDMDRGDVDTVASCDWDGDGTPDIAGGSDIVMVGGSLGGINLGVAAAVIPEVKAFAPIVPGGGLLDVGMRTEIGGAVEAMFGRLVTPMFLGYPQEDGSLQVVQMVNSVTDMETLHVATLPTVPAGGRFVVENLETGEVREGWIPEDGGFRVSIAADAADGYEKRLVAGLPEADEYDGFPRSVQDNEGLGDRLVITIYDANEAEVAHIDSFEQTILHEGVTYEAGSPLVAGNTGFGHIRGTPELRRVAMVFGAILEAGDPIAYAPYYPTGLVDDVPVNVLLMPTIGDEIVPVATGIAIARAAGLIERHQIDERYGMSQDQFLVNRGVVQGLEEWGPWLDDEGYPALFDPDDLDNGTDGTGAPSDAPLRLTTETESGVLALRLPYVRTTGTHAFALPEPEADFDIAHFAIFQVGSYLATGGTELSDDPCLEDASCSWIPAYPDEGGAR